jgi:hypothetical protein
MIKKKLLALAGAALFAMPLAALSENQEQLADKYTALAGSKQNATALVTGLRDGDKVTLKPSPAKADTKPRTFTAPTGKMGYGNIDTALALAEASLKQQGITKPTPAQLEAALMGGKVTTSSGKTVALEGILQARADGKGWGQIANSMGFKLGDVKRSDKAEPRGGRPDRVAKIERPNKPEKPQRPEKPERPEKPR